MAKKFIVDEKDIEMFSSEKIIENKSTIQIKGSEVKHIQVLRHNVSDEIVINNYNCKILDIKKDSIVLEILSTLEKQGEPNVKVNLFVGMLKGEKMDFVVQKATELGVKKIIPFLSRNVVVKLDDKAKVKKQEKYKKIVTEACKQCGRSDVVEVENIINLKDLNKYIDKDDITIFAYENEKQLLFNVLEDIKNSEKILNEKNKNKKVEENKEIKSKNINIVIGAEGGFDIEEINIFKNSDSNIYFVSLGNRILRAETAVINLLSVVMYEFDR